MSKISKLFLTAFIGISAISLSSCSFLFPTNNEGGNGQTQQEETTPILDIKTDNLLIYNQQNEYYELNLNSGESYQINASMGEYSGNNYYLKYSVSSGNGYAMVSSSGLISTSSNIAEDKNAVISVAVFSNKTKTNYLSTFIVLQIHAQEIDHNPKVTFDINDPNIIKNEDESYSLTIKSGDIYQLNPSISVKNVSSYSIYYEIVNASVNNFITIQNKVISSTPGLKEDASATIRITICSEDRETIYASFDINVTILKDDPVAGEFKVYRADYEEELIDGDKICLYVADTISFITKFDGASVNADIAIQSDILSLDSETNIISAISAGDTTITFSYTDENEFDYELTIIIEVIENSVTEIYIEKENGFLYLNGELIVLSKIYAKYANGDVVEITDETSLYKEINDKDANSKELTLSYQGADITYVIEAIETDDIALTNYAFNIRQLQKSTSTGCSTLPLSGDVNILVVPVWHTNSDSFFTENQKVQIIEDLNDRMFSDYEWSLKSYYEIESQGKITLNGKVSEFYIDDRPTTVYGDEVGFADNVHTLAENVAAWYIENNPEDPLTNYDMNNDGKFDCICLFYAANFYGSGTDNRSTAFESSYIDYDGMNDPQNLRKVNNSTYCPIGGIYGFDKKSNTSIQLEATDLSEVNPNAYKVGAQTMIHELAHAFGAKDLYTRTGHSYNDSGEGYEPAGSFSMQKDNFGGHDPMHMNLFGWANSYILSADKYQVGKKFTIELNDFQSSHNTLVLTPSWNDIDSPFDEYIMLELFSTNGMNQFAIENAYGKYSNEPAIRLWHINNYMEWANNGVMGEYLDPTTKQSLEFIASNYEEVEQGYKLAQYIRNNESATIKNKDNFSANNAFRAGDSFSMEKFANQFVKPGYLDNGKRLGWEFNVKHILENEDGTYSAIIEVERVDNTIVEFEATTFYDKSAITSQDENVHDYTDILLKDNQDLKIEYALNDGKTSSYYKGVDNTDPYIDYNGIYLYPDENAGNGGELIVSVKEKEGYVTSITGADIIYELSNVPLVLTDKDGNTQSGTSSPVYDKWGELIEMQRRMSYSFDSTSFSIKNNILDRYNPFESKYRTRAVIIEIKIYYTLIPENLLYLYGK